MERGIILIGSLVLGVQQAYEVTEDLLDNFSDISDKLELNNTLIEPSQIFIFFCF